MSVMNLEGETIFVTGAAGFIGSNLIKRVYQNFRGVKIIGIDNMNDNYDVRLKSDRLEEISKNESFAFVKGSIG